MSVIVRKFGDIDFIKPRTYFFSSHLSLSCVYSPDTLQLGFNNSSYI